MRFPSDVFATQPSRLQRAQHVNQVEEAEFFTAILNNQAPSLPAGHSYANEINSIRAGIAVGG